MTQAVLVCSNVPLRGKTVNTIPSWNQSSRMLQLASWKWMKKRQEGESKEGKRKCAVMGERQKKEAGDTGKRRRQEKKEREVKEVVCEVKAFLRRAVC